MKSSEYLKQAAAILERIEATQSEKIGEAAEIISRTVDPDANIIFGAVIDPKMEDAIRITLIATGFGAASGAAKGTPVAGHPASRTTMR